MNSAGYEDVVLRHGDTEAVTVRAHPHPDGSYTLDLPDGPVRATLAVDGRGSRIAVDGVGRDCRVVRRGCEFAVLTKARADYFHYVDPYAARRGEGASDDRVAAPIPGRVAHVLVAPGEMVAKDAPLVVIEAMKMELTLSAPVAGRVAAVNCAVEDFIEGGAELVVIDAEGEGEHPGKAG
jgi:3-methylcrotonyl-CoA carboxylase alpha subunit